MINAASNTQTPKSSVNLPNTGDFSGQIKRPSGIIVITILLGLLLIAIIVGATWGSVSISPKSLVQMTSNRLGLWHFARTWRIQDEVIFFDLRLPRVIAAGLVGLALSSAGAMFQGLLRNPLAEPYLVGTSGGASLGAVVGILFFGSTHLIGFGLVPATAFCGALLAMALVYQLAKVGGRTPTTNLLLGGFAISTVLGYIVSFLLVINDRLQLQLPRLYSWLLGGITVNSWTQLYLVAPLILAAFASSLLIARSLNAFSLGEEHAARIGTEVERDKLIIIVIGSVLTASAVAISGLVGFVGLLIPHVIRMTCGPNYRLLLPASGLAGASFMIIADLLARSLLTPAELPVGILTAFIGGPYFLYLLRKKKREYQL